MDLATWLISTRTDILADAQASLRRPAQLPELFDTVVACVNDRQLSRMTAFVDGLARERFSQGSALVEVQTAINCLEESVWRHVVAAGRPDVATELASISTVLGVAKDRLAQDYVTLASHGRAPALDLGALARGTAA